MKNIKIILFTLMSMAASPLLAGGFSLTNTTQNTVTITYTSFWCDGVWLLFKDGYRCTVPFTLNTPATKQWNTTITIEPNQSYSYSKALVWFDINIESPAGVIFETSTREKTKTLHIPSLTNGNIQATITTE